MRYFPQLWLCAEQPVRHRKAGIKFTKPTEFSLFRSVLPYSGSFSLISIAKRLQTRYHTVHGNFPQNPRRYLPMKFKRLVPLALALAIASTAAAQAARLPQNRFSFAVRPSYTQTVSRPSASTSQRTAANSSYAAQVVSGKRRACQAGTARADRQHQGAAGGADPRRRTANQLFAHVRAAHRASPR